MPANVNDGIMTKLSAYPGTTGDKQMQWLRSLVPTAPAGATLDDLWLLMVTAAGFTTGTTQERMRRWMLAEMGIVDTGYTFPDVQWYYWTNHTPTGFTPADLFTPGTRGYWLDFTDITTLFQDTGALTPVTAVGQPVMRVNDKSGTNGNNFIQNVQVNAPLYQTTAYGYGAFNGLNTSLSSITVLNMSGVTNKVTVFLQLRKTTDTAFSVALEGSPNTNANNGSFLVTAPNSAAPNVGSAVKFVGTVQTMFSAGLPAGVTPYQMTYIVDGSGGAGNLGTHQLRVNGVQVQSVDVNMGGGSFSAYTHYMGRRGSAASNQQPAVKQQNVLRVGDLIVIQRGR